MFMSDIYNNEYPGPSHRIKKTVAVSVTIGVIKKPPHPPRAGQGMTAASLPLSHRYLALYGAQRTQPGHQRVTLPLSVFVLTGRRALGGLQNRRSVFAVRGFLPAGRSALRCTMCLRREGSPRRQETGGGARPTAPDETGNITESAGRRLIEVFSGYDALVTVRAICHRGVALPGMRVGG